MAEPGTITPPADLPAEWQALFAPHRDADGRFFLPWTETPNPAVNDLMRWKASTGMFSGRRRTPPALPVLAHPLGRHEALPEGARVVWLGHASFWITLYGLQILIDPVGGDIGRLLRRAVDAPLGVDDLPPIDLVLISHGQADHLDTRTLKQVLRRNPRALLAVPLGLGALAGELTRHVLELDWWQRLRLGPVQVTFVPAQHGHRRSALDAQRALWGGWVLSGEKTIYHAGDTGYFPGFGAIGHLLGPIDLALLPLGGYEPRWMMQPVHLNPEEAVQAWQDLGARDFLGMHFGTFDLTDEPVDHGVHALPALIGERGLDPTRFHLLAHGGALGWRGEAVARAGGYHAELAGLSAPASAGLGADEELTAGSPSLGELIRRRAALTPAGTAMGFLLEDRPDGEMLDWTWGELARRSAGLAARLLELGLGGETVLITARTNAERVLGLLACWQAGAVAVPVPDFLAHDLDPLRFRDLAIDAEADALLVPAAELDAVVAVLRGHGRLRAVQCLTFDAPPADGLPALAATRDQPAALIYATGGRDDPRGVTLTHGNLLHNAIALRHALAVDAESHLVVPLLPTHDMGLVAGVVLPLLVGCPVTWIEAGAALAQPRRWLETLSVVGATHTGGPDHLFRRATPALEAGGLLDLDPLRVAWLSGGPVRPDTLDQFAAAAGPMGFDRAAFRPGYTLGEATAAVAWSDRPVSLTLRATALAADRVEPAAEGDARSLTSAGRPVVDQEIVVVRPGTDEALPAGAIGELLVRGPSIAAGYWNRRRETARRFGAGVATRGDLPFVRTGDLGFLHEGQLYVTGRVKALLIVEGRPLHPRDVEATIARARASTRPGGASAFTLEGEGGEQLVIVAELQNPDLPASRLDDEAQALVDAVHHAHGVRPWALAFVAPGHLPRVAPGRVDRAATRGRWAAHTLEIIHEWRAGGPITASRRLTPPPLVGRWTPGVDDPEAARAALRALFLERSGLGEDACIGGAEAIDLFPPLPGEPVDAWASLEQLSLAGRRTDPPAARQAARRRVFESLRARLDVGRPLLLQAHAWRHADREQRPAHWLQAFHPEAAPPFAADLLIAAEPYFAVRWIADAREDLAAALAAWSPPAIAAEALAHARAQVEAGEATLLRALFEAI